MKIKNVLILLIMTLILFCPTVFAAKPQISIEGEANIKTGGTKNLAIKISSEIEVGIVTGVIERNKNITNMTVTAKNNWNVTYNPDTGIFNAFKTEGAKLEEIMNIEYTVVNIESVGSITLSNIEINTIEYETTNVEKLTKEITIKEELIQEKPSLVSIKILQDPTKTTYKEGEKFDATGMELEATYSDGTTKKITDFSCIPNGTLKTTDNKITVSYTENGVVKTTEQTITVTSAAKQDPSKLQENLPKAGSTQYLLIALVSILIISFVLYKVLKKNKDI